MGEQVIVEQGDRELATALTGYESFSYGMGDLSDAVQLCARHRIAAHEAGRREGVEAAQGVALSHSLETSGVAYRASREIARRIRSLLSNKESNNAG